ncbi:MAG: VWA domain-containing protein, partial [bacterium]|nr:VWA domain-containing protein [bacterium]
AVSRRNRELNVFSLSALDLFAGAMGAFILIAVVLFPYYLKETKTPIKVRNLDVVFVIDTTVSMGSAIDQLKSELVGLSKVLERVAPQVRIGIIAYKTRRSDSQYLIISKDLTSTKNNGLRELQEWVNRLTPQGGGYEVLADALERATRMSWQPNRRRLIVLIADEPGEPGTLSRALGIA